ncbi:MAG: GNAT family N-acetyltransferase [Candidatus Methanofastidiosia archaeon]|jgi:ribosomal protein S18 acetylase RimI-like enzyme
MEPTIRKASLKDVDAIVTLNSTLADYHASLDQYYKPGCKTESYFREKILEVIFNKNIHIVVAETNEIIGYIIGVIEEAKPFVIPDTIGKISHAFIRKEYRHQGVGKTLVMHVLKWFKEHDITYVELSVDSRNESAIAAWHNLGFKEYMKKMRLHIGEI